MRPRSNKAVITALPSGLRVISRRWPGAPVEYCGIVVLAGSRDDGPDAHGLAHFVEHTIFKGTEKRSSWHIINRMERVGGELNAYTSKEETVVYTAAPSGNLDRAFELIADLATSSRFPDSELDKEREVVADEINSYLDIPADALFDDFEDMIFAGTPLGHNILGTTESIATFDSMACCDYLRRWYTAPNMALYYCGPASPDRVYAVAEKHFSCLSPTATLKVPYDVTKQAEPFRKTRKLGIHQAHTVMGSIVGGMYSPDRYARALLTNILGGPGMNSLLNVSLRERRGLVYSVEASTSLLTNCGLFTVYFGCDPEDTAKCEALVREQIDGLAQSPMSELKLSQAKKQYIGQLAVASENRENDSIATGRAALYFNHMLTPAEVADRIRSVSTADIVAAAQEISNLSMLTFE